MKDDYSYWSENLHSAYLFYTLEVDKLNKENKRLREALKQIIINAQRKGHDDFTPVYLAKQALGE